MRVATPADEPFLAQMARLAAGWRDDVPAPMTAQLEAYMRGFGRAGDHGVVAEEQGGAWYRLLGADGHGFVAEDVPELAIAVLPHARGQGLGSALLARLIADAHDQGHRGLSLSVRVANPARRLYERLGFVKVGENGSAWKMLRTLS